MHHYKGRPYSASALKHLRADFRQSYEAVIQAKAQQTFVEVFRNQTVEAKTFAHFHADVGEALRRIDRQSGPASTVVTVAGNSYAHLVFQAAAWLGGRTLCPVNPNEGQDRIQAKIKSLNTEVSVWTEAHMELGPASGADWHARKFPAEKPFAFLFTSGSSGESKVVEWSEQNLLANADALISHHRMNEGLHIGTPLPVYHVNAMGFSFLSSLLAGSRLVLFDRFDLASLQTALRAGMLDVLSLTPTHLRLLVNRAHVFSASEWKPIRYVVSAAAPLSCELIKDFIDRFGVRIVQGYGLSEAVNFSATLPIDLSDVLYRELMLQGPHPSVGTALWGNEIEILDEQGGQCPPETAGHIVIRGFNVMRGYRGIDPADTFAGGYLPTGDVGYFKERDGRKFYFVSSRKKDIIKRYGETISLREVDDLFRPFNSECDCIAIGFPNDVAGEELGLIVNDREADLPARLERFMKEKIPLMFRPKVFLSTRRELRTASGKPQRWRFLNDFAEFKLKPLGAKIIVKSDPEGA